MKILITFIDSKDQFVDVYTEANETITSMALPGEATGLVDKWANLNKYEVKDYSWAYPTLTANLEKVS